MDSKKLEVQNVTDESLVDSDVSARRDFIKKYGKLAAVTPVALTLSMHSSKAMTLSQDGSGGEDGGGPGF